jgi:hypothetical protein
MKIVAIFFSNAQGSKSAGVNLEKEKALLEGCKSGTRVETQDTGFPVAMVVGKEQS